MHYQELDEAWRELTAQDAPFETIRTNVNGTPLLAYRRASASVRDLWMATRAFSDREYLVYGSDIRLSRPP